MKYLNIGEILAVNARKFPDKIALKDSRISRTFPELEIRTNKIANAFLDIGVKKGDKIAVLLNNSLEFMEIYLAAAKMGAVIVPVNFRLIEKEIQYIVNNSDATTFIVQSREPSYINTIDTIRSNLENIPDDRYISLGTESPPEYSNFEWLVTSASESIPEITVENEATWIAWSISGRNESWRKDNQKPNDWLSAAKYVSAEIGVQIDFHTPLFSATLVDGEIRYQRNQIH